MTVSKEAASMLTIKGFMAVYFRKLKDADTYEQAYELTEREYKKHFGFTRYSSYDSFRRTKYRYLQGSK